MAKATCARCGRPAEGFATINEARYCHGDDQDPTCFMLSSWGVPVGETADAAGLARMLGMIQPFPVPAPSDSPPRATLTPDLAAGPARLVEINDMTGETRVTR